MTYRVEYTQRYLDRLKASNHHAFDVELLAGSVIERIKARPREENRCFPLPNDREKRLWMTNEIFDPVKKRIFVIFYQINDTEEIIIIEDIKDFDRNFSL